jgi:hypothetical protein
MAKELIFYENVAEETSNLLVQQFKTKQNFINFIQALCSECQLLEDVFKQLYTECSLETAFGEQLDGIGQIVGLDRNGENDDDYRVDLKLQILINASKGQPEILITALKIFTRSTVVILYEFFPAKCGGYFDNFANYPANLNNKMQQICAGGVKWLFSIVGNEFPFACDAAPSSGLAGGLAGIDADGNIVTDTAGMLVYAF